MEGEENEWFEYLIRTDIVEVVQRPTFSFHLNKWTVNLSLVGHGKESACTEHHNENDWGRMAYSLSHLFIVVMEWIDTSIGLIAIQADLFLLISKEWRIERNQFISNLFYFHHQ